MITPRQIINALDAHAYPQDRTRLWNEAQRAIEIDGGDVRLVPLTQDQINTLEWLAGEAFVDRDESSDEYKLWRKLLALSNGHDGSVAER